MCWLGASLALAQEIVPLLPLEAAGKISADDWRKVHLEGMRQFLVEFRDPAIPIEIDADLARRRQTKIDATALNLKRDRFGQLKQRNFSALNAGDSDVVRDFSHLPIALVRIRDAGALVRLLARPEVAGVYENRRMVPADTGLDLIGQTQASQLLGQTGTGKTIVVLDTGVDYTQATFGSCPDPLPAVPPAGCKVLAAFDLTLAYGNNPYPPVLTVPPYYPQYDDGSKDNFGHGTVVAATALSVAPNARIVAIDVMNEPPWSDFTGATSDSLIAGINWAIANQAAYNIAAINMSLAGGFSYATPCASGNPLMTPVQEAQSAGIVTVAASGNNGNTNGILYPACTPGVVSVGAVYDTDTAGCSPGTKDSIACFSNVANYLSLLTPSGATSFAAPQVSAAVAVLASAFPSELPSVRAFRMTQSGKPVIDNRTGGLGYVIPRLDIAAALLFPASPPPANNDFAAATVLSGDAGSVLGWNFYATRENGEPVLAGASGGASLWWKWSATTSGNLSLDSHGSNFDTLLGVYTGSSLAALKSIAANDNDGVAGGVSGLTFHAEAGTTYYFSLDGKAGVTGDLYLNRSFVADPPTTANLSVTLTYAPTVVTSGTLLTYTLTVRNSGPASAANVAVSQTLPAGVSFVSADSGCSLNGTVVNCALGSIAAAGQAVRNVVVTVNSTAALTSQIQVTSSTADGDPANNSATVVVNGSTAVPLPAWALVLLAGCLVAGLRRRV